MSELMRKILYYENILEFKENTKSPLLRSEVNGWRRLCRTCLADADETSGCVDLERMSMLGMDGNLLSLQHMLSEATGTQILFAEEQHRNQLPISICKDCVSKVTTLYYFKLQTKRAEKVLERLLAKLKEADAFELAQAELYQQKVETTTSTDDDVNLPPDCSSTSGTDGFMIYECNSKSELATNCADAPQSDMPLKLEQSLADELVNALEESVEEFMNEKKNMEEVVENESKAPDLTDNLGEITYIEIDEGLEEDEEEEEQEEEKEDETIESATIQEHDEDNTETTTTDSIVQEYYLEDLQQLEDNFDVDSCSNDAISIVMLNEETDQEKEDEEDEEEFVSNDVKIKHETVSTKGTADNRLPKRRRKSAKSDKPLLENLNCIVCNEEFDKLRLLTEHVQRDHPAAKAFKCRICGNGFAHMQSLSRHMRHHKPQQRKYVCDQITCGKEFLRPDDWTRHMRIHTGERPYACDKCPKAFKQPSELKEHQRSHSTEKLFQCDICNHRLSSRNGLYVHKKAHSGVKNFLCVYCEKRFLTSGELKSHSKLHMKKFKKDEH